MYVLMKDVTRDIENDEYNDPPPFQIKQHNRLRIIIH